MARKANVDAVHRQISKQEVETVFEDLLSRFVEADRHTGDEARDEARTMYIAERCVKTVLDILKIPGDIELLRKWSANAYRSGPIVEDTVHRMVARSGYDGSKHLDHIARTHEVWRKTLKEFGGIE